MGDFIANNLLVILFISIPFLIIYFFSAAKQVNQYVNVKNKETCSDLIKKKYPENKGILMPSENNNYWQVIIEKGQFKRNPQKMISIYFNKEQPIKIIKEVHHIRGENGERKTVKTKKY